MIAPHSHPAFITSAAATAIEPRLRHRAAITRGFSLTELLVVIGIIILLIGLLLVALQQVRKKALRTRTETLMAQFANACTTFQSEHGFYPGVIPDDVLNNAPDLVLSYTENALLHLMGGYRVLSPNDYGTSIQTEYDAYKAQAQSANADIELTFSAGSNPWKIIVDRRKIGEGPVINGKPYAPYFTPGPSDIGVARHKTTTATPELPDLLDGWGNPMVYVRQVRNRGPLVGADFTTSPRPQFLVTNGDNLVKGIDIYTGAKLDELASLPQYGLGDLGKDQVRNSIFHAGLTDVVRQRLAALLLSHPAFYKTAQSKPPGDPLLGSPRGAFFLWSAGADGVFLSRTDGPGSPTDPINAGNVDQKLITPGPRVLDEFDDVRYYGGG